MIGTRVTLRLRMSAHDAHYAGELVDGARMLALFLRSYPQLESVPRGAGS